MDDCIFCKIVKGEIPSEKKKETQNFIVVPDIKPSAKVHLLIISKEHLSDLASITDDLWNEARKIAMNLQKDLNLDEFQFRVNWGKLLEVKHLHMHLLAELNN